MKHFRRYFLLVSVFFFSCLNSFSENILNSINDALTLNDFMVMASDYNEGAYIDYDYFKNSYKSYSGGSLTKYPDRKRTMYTFHTEFFLDSSIENERIACYVDPVEYPYNIYINGILIYKKSRFKDNLATSRFSTSAVFLSAELLNFGEEPNSFIFQIYPVYKTDPISNIKILDYDRAMEEVFWRNFFSIHLIQGAFILSLVIAIYYLFLFIAYKYREKTHLYYALFCVCFAFAYISMSFQYYSDSVILLEQISRAGHPFCVAFFLLFLLEFNSLFVKYKKLIIILSLSLCFIFSIIIFLQDSPRNIELVFSYVMNIVILPILVLAFLVLIAALLKFKDISSAVLFTAFSLMLITNIHDIYYMNTEVNPYIWLTPYGFIAIIFSTVLILALENSKVYFRSIQQASEIKKSYDALKKSEEKNIAILNTIPDSMFYLDSSGLIIDYNASDNMDRFTITKHIINKNVKDVLPDVLSSAFIHSMDKILNNKDAYTVENEIEYNNSYYELRMVSSGEYNLLAIVRDITIEKESQYQAKIQQEQLIRTDKLVALGTLVAGVAHEINNPNNSILLTTDILLDTWKGIAPILDEFLNSQGDFPIGGYSYSELRYEIPESFMRVINNSRRIKSIISDLKNFARKDVIVNKQSVNINEIIESSIRLLDSTIKHNSSNFEVNCDQNIPFFQGQPQRLEQVIINLIQNACNSLEDKSKQIKVISEYLEKENKIHIRIQDQGCGMDKETLKRIYDPFFTTRRDKGGTGLGLSVSNQIIKEHNGEMIFESDVGKGTTANIIIPL
jgi:signal transduction histidine kinase/PAS domain-containing protein